jgi:hypothetical protein
VLSLYCTLDSLHKSNAYVVFLVLFKDKILGATNGVVNYAKITFLNFNLRAKGKSLARNA